MIIIDMMMRTKTGFIIRKNGDMMPGFNCYDFLIESLMKPTWDMSSFCCTKNIHIPWYDFESLLSYQRKFFGQSIPKLQEVCTIKVKFVIVVEGRRSIIFIKSHCY